MAMKKFLLAIIVTLSFSSALVIWARSQTRTQATIIGRWQVLSQRSDIQNHTYEFYNNGTCIEKYRSVAEPVSATESADIDYVITYRYRYLGQSKYRLYPVKLLPAGRPTVAPTWFVLHVTFNGNKAIVYEADAQGLEDIKQSLKDSVVFNNAEKPASSEKEVWERLS